MRALVIFAVIVIVLGVTIKLLFQAPQDFTTQSVRRVTLEYAQGTMIRTGTDVIASLLGRGLGALRTDHNPNGDYLLVELTLNRTWMEDNGMLSGLTALVGSRHLRLEIVYPAQLPASIRYSGSLMPLDDFRGAAQIVAGEDFPLLPNHHGKAVKVSGFVHGVAGGAWTIRFPQRFEQAPESANIDASKLPPMPHYRDGMRITVWGICREDGTIEAWLSEMVKPDAQLLVPANKQNFAGQGGEGTAFWLEEDQIIAQQGLESTVNVAALFLAPPGQEKAVLRIGDKEIKLLK